MSIKQGDGTSVIGLRNSQDIYLGETVVTQTRQDTGPTLKDLVINSSYVDIQPFSNSSVSLERHELLLKPRDVQNALQSHIKRLHNWNSMVKHIEKRKEIKKKKDKNFEIPAMTLMQRQRDYEQSVFSEEELTQLMTPADMLQNTRKR
jgi:hypothetical protein